jgi:hypothetical protein
VKYTVPTLTALALMGTIPAFGASIADDLTIKPKAQIQARAQLGANGSGTNGDEYNIYSGANGLNDAMRLSLRRARFGASAKNSTGWDAEFLVRAGERADAGSTPGTTGTTPTVALYYAYIGKSFKTDVLEHRVALGLNKPFNGESSISSSTYMFPNDRAVANLIEYRGQEVGYTLKHDLFKFGFDIANGGNWSNFSNAALGDQNGNAGGILPPSSQGANTSVDTRPGTFFSGRIEFSPGADFMPTKKSESFAGAEGHHIVIGLDVQSDQKDQVATTNAAPSRSVRQTTTMYGPDALIHFNAISAIADYRLIQTKQMVDGGTPANNAAAGNVDGYAYDIRFGYAIPMESGLIVEPAIGYGLVNLNKNLDEGGVAAHLYKQGEWQAGQVSGSQFELGVNLYWNGHANKTQIAYTKWTAEDNASVNGESPDASVFTIQQQVTF